MGGGQRKWPLKSQALGGALFGVQGEWAKFQVETLVGLEREWARPGVGVLPVQHIPATWIFMTAAPPTYTQEVDRLPLRLTGRRGQDSAVELGVVAQRQMQADLYRAPGQAERAMQSNHI